MRRRPPLVAAALASPLAMPAAAACTCSAGVPEAKRFAAADAAFVGVLESRRALDPPRPDGVVSSADRFVHRYRVQRRHKGRRDRSAQTAAVAACRRPA